MNKFGWNINWSIKRFFTPTEQDEILPLGLGQEAFFLYFLLALIIILSPAYIRVSELASLANPVLNFTSAQMVELINASRLAIGLPPLTDNTKLDDAASRKVDDMFNNQYFAHFSPTNRSPWDFFREADYRYYAAGENLALDFTDAGSAHIAFMNSPTHRANILNPLYAEVGISIKQGDYNSRMSVMVAEYFGKERAAQTAAIIPTASAAASLQITPPPSIVKKTPPPIAAKKKAVAMVPTKPTSTVLGAGEASPQAPQTAPVATAPATSPVERVAPPVVPPTSAIHFLPAHTSEVQEFLTPQVEVKLLAALVVLSILLSLLFLIMRGGAVSVPVATRVIVLLLLFGYIAYVGIDMPHLSRITPSSASAIVSLVQ